MPKRSTLISVILVAVSASSCVGEPIGSFESGSQNFKWGSMHAWISSSPGSKWDARDGSGYLLLNASFKKKYLEKSCTLEVQRLVLTDPDKDEALIDVVPRYSDGDVMRRELGEYDGGQFSMRNYPFEFSQFDAPYDVDIDLKFTCDGKTGVDTFSKPIRFKMVQPVIWEQ